MAQNTRRNKKSDNPEESTEDTVTDIESPAVEADTEAKEAVDHEGNLYQSIIDFASDGDVAKLQERYRAVPAASRGRVQGAAMKRAMSENGIDMDVLGNVLDAWSNLPTAAKVSRTRTEMDPTTAGGIRLYALMQAFEDLQKELGEDAYNLADRWKNTDDNPLPKEYQNTVDRIVTKVTSASTARGGGGSGPRTMLKESLKDLVERGALPVGSELQGAGGVTATVTPDGKLSTNGEEYDAPSAAAKAHRTSADGKATSTNGWDFWQYEGKPIGSLRTH